MSDIIFTSDVDWAHEEVLLNVIELFSDFEIKCTFFATHKSDVLLSANPSLFEIAIHPNFNNRLFNAEIEKTCQSVVGDLLEIYPNAQGTRSHSLTQNSLLLDLYSKLGLKYESNILLPYQKVTPFRQWDGLLRIPFNWEDDIHWLYGNKFNSMSMDTVDGPIIANFHPIHIFLNTEGNERYNEAKRDYHSISHLRKCINKTGPGARTLLMHLLRSQTSDTGSLKLIEYAESY